MNKLLISLLKGSIKDKISLLNVITSEDELLSICNSSLLKERYNLEKGKDFSRYREIRNDLEKLNISILAISDNEYPDCLKEIYDPPFLLYVRGDITALNNPLVSVVGTRKPTLKGYHSAFRIGMDLGRCGVGVVSGLALGIDGAVHKGNITTGGNTIAVLGSGIDTIYPGANKELAGDILRSGGLIVSEFPPGDIIRKYNFPKRNRIVAGLCRHLVIIQAPKRSGSLITGDFALQNGSDVYVHSSGIGDIRFSGSDKYYKEGAEKIDSSMPVLKRFGMDCDLNKFETENYSSAELLKMELDGKVVKYRGGYFLK